jgi:frataxin-like iron-binding protein CyaY
MTTLEKIKAALEQLGDKVIGLQVEHRGHIMDVQPLGTEEPVWCAFGYPDAMDEHGYPEQVDASAETIQEALDRCADAMDEAEAIDV